MLVEKTQIMDQKAMSRAITRISFEIIERNKGVSGVVLVGIRRRGEPLARMLADAIDCVEGVRPPVGTRSLPSGSPKRFRSWKEARCRWAIWM